MLCDMLAINTAFILVYIFNLETIRRSGQALPNDTTSVWVYIALSNLAFAGVFIVQGLYHMRRGASRVDEAYKLFTAVSLATILSTLLINMLVPTLGFDQLPWLPQVMLLAWGAAVISTIGLRAFHRILVNQLRRRGVDTRRALIVGAHQPGLAVWHTIRRSPELGYRVQGFLSNIHPVGTVLEGLPVLGRIEYLDRVVRVTRTDEVLIALSQRSQQDLMNIVTLAEDEAVAIKVYPDTFQLITNNEVSIGDLSGLPLISVKNAALENPWNRFLKRSLDILFSFTVLVLISPILMLIALLVTIDSPGGVFFLQERVGMDNKPFLMIKFRTMRSDAESRGPGWTTANDPRVTRLGRFLRRYSLDELPQFMNVLIGDMSVVGPRPEQPKWVAQFQHQVPRYLRRHKEKAGITGWAQVNGLRGDTSIEERTRYDLYYIENWSLLFDIKIILRTALDFLSGKQENAY